MPKNIFKFAAVMCFVACLVIADTVLSSKGGTPARGGNILVTLQALDNELCQNGFSASFTLQIPAHPFDADQGQEIQSGGLTCNASEKAMHTTSSYDTSPVYQPPGTIGFNSSDYTAAGDFILWRHVEKYVLFAPDVNDTVADVKVLDVTPEGSIAAEDPHKQFFKYAIGSDENVYEVEQFLLGVGRGFSEHLDSVLGEVQLPDGLLQVIAQGTYGTGHNGTWVLILDQNADHVVRSATFTNDEIGELVLTVTTTGTLQAGGLTIAQQGMVVFDAPEGHADYEIEIVVESFVAAEDAQLLQTARDEIEAVPAVGTEIVDYRSDPPVRIFVGE